MTTFGMEFEVQGVQPRAAAIALTTAGIPCSVPDRVHATCSTWKAVYDGSVQEGAEVVSPILTAARLNEAHKVTRALKSAGARVDAATGFHVHLGADAFADRDGDISEGLAMFIHNWYGVHSAIGAMVSASRLNNRYCKVLNRDDAADAAAFIRNGNLGDIYGDRYRSVNLEALGRHGTVEIRLHQGTLNGIKAIGWARFVAAMADASRRGLDIVADLSLYTTETAYLNRPRADVAACHRLLHRLTIAGLLNPATADYLKNRAKELHA